MGEVTRTFARAHVPRHSAFNLEPSGPRHNVRPFHESFLPDKLSRSSDLGRQLLFEGFRPTSNGDPTAPLSKVEALRWSAGKGLLPLTQRLIGECADVDAKMGDDDAPALHDAVYYEHYHVMYALVDARASVSAVAGTGTTLLHFLATGNEGVKTTEAIRFLVGKGLDVDRKGL